jgi:CMP-N-acetylneuraminic acid synthetase
MKEKQKFTAFLPIKLNSERVQGKNFRLIAGKPLFFYVLNTLTNVNLINEIVIDFDDQKVVTEVEKYFKNIKFIKRKENLLDPYESLNNLIYSNIGNFKNENIIQTHVTNPLLRGETIRNALMFFLESDKPLFSVSRFNSRFYNHNLKPVNHSLAKLLPTQKLDPLYEENSNFYIFSKNQFLEKKNRINQKSRIFEVSKLESFDIDDEEDFEIVTQLLNAKNL